MKTQPASQAPVILALRREFCDTLRQQISLIEQQRIIGHVSHSKDVKKWYRTRKAGGGFNVSLYFREVPVLHNKLQRTFVQGSLADVGAYARNLIHDALGGTLDSGLVQAWLRQQQLQQP